jgi:hypothetical protein
MELAKNNIFNRLSAENEKSNNVFSRLLKRNNYRAGSSVVLFHPLESLLQGKK